MARSTEGKKQSRQGPLQVADYPLSQYSGAHFEFVDAYSMREAAYRAAFADAVAGNDDSIHKASELKRDLDQMTKGDMVARVYPADAKHLEFIGSADDAQAWVADQMAQLKKAED